MSVIKLTRKDIDEIEGMLLYQLGARDWDDSPVKRAVENSGVFAQKATFSVRAGLGIDEVKSGELARHVLLRLVWYLWVANKTAFALQYRKEPGFFDDAEDGETPEKICTAKQLLDSLSNLSYNLYTNDGHCFLGGEWSDLFEGIINGLRAKIVKASE